MALRAGSKTIVKEIAPIETPRELAGQGRRSEERFRLQVDRQTKRSFTTLEAAEAAGLVIKKAYPIVQVSVYDAVDGINRTVSEAARVEPAA